MAKKLINVVYKVDDSELTKVKVNIQNLATATKATETAMTSMSSKASAGNAQASQTIAGMTLRMQQLRAQIELTKTSDTERLNKLRTDYQAVKKQVDDFNKSLETTNKTGSSSLGIFQNLQTTIVGMFSVAAVKQLITWNLEMNKLAGNVQAVDLAFRRAFPNADILIGQLRTSTHNTITDFELMKQAIQAQNLGIPIEHLGKLLEFAATRAQQTGQSVDYLVDSIVKGIGRKSILFFDQLGISTTRLKEEMGGVAIRSQTVGDVSAAVTKIVGEEMVKMGGYAETSATKVSQLEVAWQNLKIQVSKKVESSGLTEWMTSIVNGFRYSLMSSKEISENVKKSYAVSDVTKFIKSQEQTVKSVQEELGLRKSNLATMELELQALKNRNAELIAKHSPETIDEQDRIKNDFKALQDRYNIQKATIPLLEEYGKQLEKNAIPETNKVGYIQAIKDEIDDLNTAISEASRDQLPSLNEKLDQLQQKLKVAQIARPLKPSDETKNDKEMEAQILRDANEIIEKDTEDHYQRSLDQLRTNIKDERNEKDIARSLENQKQKEANDAIEALEKDHQQRLKALKQMEIEVGLHALDQILTATLINRQTDTADLEAFYQSQLDAAGNNEQAKKAVQKKIDADRQAQRLAQIEQDKEDAVTKIEIDTAVNVIRSIMNNGGIPLGLPFGALAAAAGLIQAATVRSVSSKSLKTRAFAKGEVDIDGPGPKGVDSINALIAPGESVINHEATAASRNLLEAINERKIDDTILYRLAGDGGRQAQNFDDTGIIRAIENSRVDYVKQGYTLMKVERQGDSFKRYIRSKVQGY